EELLLSTKRPRKRVNHIVLRENFASILVQSKKFGPKAVWLDIADLPTLSGYTWSVKYDSHIKGFYACTSIKNVTIYLHNFLLKPGPELMIDHITPGSTLDNRRQNIRIVSPRGNAHNRKDQAPFVGVFENKG